MLKVNEDTCQINKPFKTLFGLYQDGDRYDIRKLLTAVDPTYSGVVEKVWLAMTEKPTVGNTFVLKERTGTTNHFHAQVSLREQFHDDLKLLDCNEKPPSHLQSGSFLLEVAIL